MSNNEMIYALHALCAGGCQRKILGPCRRESAPEFSAEVREDFYKLVEEHGWTRMEGDETGALWKCNTDCKPPWDFDPKEFSISPEMRERIKKLKPINPDYYGTVTIENLEP